MKIPEIDNAIEECKNHLSLSEEPNPKIESFLASYLLILIISCFEREFIKIAKNNVKCKNCKNIQNQYFSTTVDRLFKKFRISDIGDFLKFLSQEHREKFSRMQKNKKIARVCTSYNNIQENRQLVAHSSGVNMTISEVILSYEECNIILDLFAYFLAYDPLCIKECRKREKDNAPNINEEQMSNILQSFFNKT